MQLLAGKSSPKCLSTTKTLDAIKTLEATYSAPKREDGTADLGDVLLLEQIDSLEEISVRNSVLLDGLEEGTDVLHNLEGHRGILVDLLHASGLNTVNQPKKCSSKYVNTTLNWLGKQGSCGCCD